MLFDSDLESLLFVQWIRFFLDCGLYYSWYMQMQKWLDMYLYLFPFCWNWLDIQSPSTCRGTEISRSTYKGLSMWQKTDTTSWLIQFWSNRDAAISPCLRKGTSTGSLPKPSNIRGLLPRTYLISEQQALPLSWNVFLCLRHLSMQEHFCPRDPLLQGRMIWRAHPTHFPFLQTLPALLLKHVGISHSGRRGSY